MKVFTSSQSSAVVLLVMAQSLLSYQFLFGQQSDQQPNQQQNQQPTTQAQSSSNPSAPDEHADDHSLALGVLVSSCPGEAVCVRDVIWGSPADEEGIQPGDYILSVDGQKATTPAAFKKMLEQKDPNQKVNLKIWRQSQQIEKAISLAAESKKLPDSHDAWLGVMLAPSDSDGVEIQQVVPGSPADKAGLKSGEMILRMNEQEVTNVETFVEGVNDFGPGKQLKLAVRGNGSQREVQVTLGAIRNAPMRFLREIYSDVMDDLPFQSSTQNVSLESLELIDQTLDQMRQQIHTLEEQVQELRSGKEDSSQRERTTESKEDKTEPANDSGLEAESRSQDRSQHLRSDASALSVLPTILASTVSTSIVQQDGRRSDWNRNRGRNWNNYNWRNRSPYQSYYSRYGYPYGYYSYPNYGNSYYRYGGRPYFYGGTYGSFGYPRYGIRSGTGIFWY